MAEEECHVGSGVQRFLSSNTDIMASGQGIDWCTWRLLVNLWTFKLFSVWHSRWIFIRGFLLTPLDVLMISQILSGPCFLVIEVRDFSLLILWRQMCSKGRCVITESHQIIKPSFFVWDTWWSETNRHTHLCTPNEELPNSSIKN